MLPNEKLCCVDAKRPTIMKRRSIMTFEITITDSIFPTPFTPNKFIIIKTMMIKDCSRCVPRLPAPISAPPYAPNA